MDIETYGVIKFTKFYSEWQTHIPQSYDCYFMISHGTFFSVHIRLLIYT